MLCTAHAAATTCTNHSASRATHFAPTTLQAAQPVALFCAYGRRQPRGRRGWGYKSLAGCIGRRPPIPLAHGVSGPSTHHGFGNPRARGWKGRPTREVLRLEPKWLQNNGRCVSTKKHRSRTVTSRGRAAPARARGPRPPLLGRSGPSAVPTRPAPAPPRSQRTRAGNAATPNLDAPSARLAWLWPDCRPAQSGGGIMGQGSNTAPSAAHRTRLHTM